MRHFRIPTVLLLGTLTALLTGCSRNPMSPDPTGAQGGAQMMGVQTDDSPVEAMGGMPGTATAALEVGAEARLTVGRFTLDLHKNTLKKPVTITLHVASENATEVEIEVLPADANNFQVAAELTANMSDLPGTDYNTAWMDYLGTGGWEPCVDVSTHPNQKTVVARMKQLTNCRVTEGAPNLTATGELTRRKK